MDETLDFMDWYLDSLRFPLSNRRSRSGYSMIAMGLTGLLLFVLAAESAALPGFFSLPAMMNGVHMVLLWLLMWVASSQAQQLIYVPNPDETWGELLNRWTTATNWQLNAIFIGLFLTVVFNVNANLFVLPIMVSYLVSGFLLMMSRPDDLKRSWWIGLVVLFGFFGFGALLLHILFKLL